MNNDEKIKAQNSYLINKLPRTKFLERYSMNIICLPGN